VSTLPGSDAPAAIDRFLRAVESGDWAGLEPYLTEDVLYDASVPGWRYRRIGRPVVLQELGVAWTGKHTWRIVELHVSPTTDGAVVDLELRGRCPGDEDHPAHEEACRMANIFRLDDGRICEHRFYCCGEWDEETIRRIDEERATEGRRAP
jgi:hypothetical protein